MLNHADFKEPITTGIFVSIAVWTSYQRDVDKTPLKAKDELIDGAKFRKGY